jgi:2-methylcitrate dehydratase PrpD
MRLISLRTLVLHCVWLTTTLALASAAAFGQSEGTDDVVIKNAIVMTATHGNITNGSSTSRTARSPPSAKP